MSGFASTHSCSPVDEVARRASRGFTAPGLRRGVEALPASGASWHVTRLHIGPRWVRRRGRGQMPHTRPMRADAKNLRPLPSTITRLNHVTTNRNWRSRRDRIGGKHAIAEPARIQRTLRGAWFLSGGVRRIGRWTSQRRGFKRREPDGEISHWRCRPGIGPGLCASRAGKTSGN